MSDALPMPPTPSELHDLHARLEQARGSGGFAWWPASGRVLASVACARRHRVAGDATPTLGHLLEAYAPDARRLLREALEQAADGEEDGSPLELALADADGNTVWLDWTVHAQDGADGARCVVAGYHERRVGGGGATEAAHLDALTGLSNRLGLRTRGPLAVAAAGRSGRPLALLFIDLDHFKQVNDTQGHHAGDELLREVAHRLRACVRGSDLVARQSGDEFVIVLGEMQRQQDAGLVAQKIVDALSRPFHLGAAPVQVGCSIGIALLGESSPDFDALMQAADKAMYAAKHAGRNTFRYYNDAFSQRLQQRTALEQQLRRAIERDEIFLDYQPSLRCDDDRIGGIEALLRWRAPGGELRRPNDFLVVAEECGEIVAIGRWALREACRQARQWCDTGLDFDRITVNVSAVQLRASEFADEVLAACRDAGLEPARLELELPEAAMLADRDATRRVLATLQPQGVAFSIDDFGTGVSNLIALHRFRLSSLKLDRHFALGMQDDPGLQDLARAVIGIGHALRLRMVAKGVESQEAAEFLGERGCDEIQGFHVARPMPAADVALWWNARSLAPRTLAGGSG